jgi:hypothetical protein
VSGLERHVHVFERFCGSNLSAEYAKLNAAGEAKFDSLDTDHDGTLDKSEYLGLVEARFKAADTDHDGTISGAEFSTKAGQALVHLLK